MHTSNHTLCMLVTGNLVISIINYMELRNFLITLHNSYQKSNTMLVNGNLVTSIINYMKLRNFLIQNHIAQHIPQIINYAA